MMAGMPKECDISESTREHDTQSYWNIIKFLILLTVLVFSISTYIRVNNRNNSCNGSYNDYHVGQHASTGLTFSNSMQLHALLEQSVVNPIVILVLEKVGSGAKYHGIALRMRQSISPSLVEFAMAPNSFCTEAVATLDITTLEILICGNVVPNKISSAASLPYNYQVHVHWEEAGVEPKQNACENDYLTCISNRQYPSIQHVTHVL